MSGVRRTIWSGARPPRSCAPASRSTRGVKEALDFAGDGTVASHFSWERLENINAIFERMEKDGIDGRIVLDMN